MAQDTPDKVIDIPGLGATAFPGSMSDADINAAAAKLYQQSNPNHPPPDPKHSWIDTAVEWLPTAGGVIGGVAGFAVGGPPGAIAGAALGGAAGEGYRETARYARGTPVTASPLQAVKNMGTQAVLQGGAEAVGAGIGAAAKPAAEAIMHSALKPGLKVAMQAVRRGETPEVVKTLLKEGINVTPGGVDKLTRIIDASNEEISNAIQSIGGDVNPFKVTARLRDTAKTFGQQVNSRSDLDAVSRVGQEFLEDNPRLSLQEAQAVKTGTYRQLKGKYGELKGAEVEAQKALARGLKEEIEDEVSRSLPGIKGQLGLPGGVNLAKANAREASALAAREAVARRVAVAANNNPMGLASLAISHPVTFLTALADRSPAVKSLIARGLYSEAGRTARVSPQLIRVAVKAIVQSEDTSTANSQSQ